MWDSRRIEGTFRGRAKRLRSSANFWEQFRFLRRKPILDSAEKKNAFVAGELAEWRHIAESTDFNQK